MASNDNNSKNIKDKSNIESGSYDYLDLLMQDMMDTGESQSEVNSSSESALNSTQENHNEKAEHSSDSDIINTDVNPGEQESLGVGISDSHNNINQLTKKGRTPLLHQLNKDLATINESDKSSKDSEEDLKIVTKEKVNVSEVFSNVSKVDKKENNREVNIESHDDNISPLFESKENESNNENVNNIKYVSVDNLANEDNKESSDDDIGSPDSNVDNFDSMLAGLTLDIESENKDKESDTKKDSIVVPLETKDMNQIKVTADGKTLAEMIPGMRSGNKTVNQKVAEITNRKTVVKANNKKFSDNRYIKHIQESEKERAYQEKKKALSMKFLQRNANFSEHEKIIMSNLGVTNNQFSKLMGSKELTKKEKEEILALGRYGAESHFKGRRYRTTVGDTAMLKFLAKFKFANTRILRWISNEPQGRTWRKLNRLRENGLAESKSLIGVPDLWGATSAGMAISGYPFPPGLKPMPKMITISSTMGVNYIAACLWFNTINVLNLDDFPAHNRIISLQEDGRERVRGEMLVSEFEIRSSLGKEINPHSTTMQSLGDERLYDVIATNVRAEVSKWADGGKIGHSPEFALGNEYMWVLYPMNQLTLSYHVPDLIIKRERGPNGEPKSIAVEMERYEKTSDRYDKTMLAYKLDEHLYEKVVWITPNNRVARALEAAAKQVGFDRYAIVPIITETGIYNKQDIWMI
ncbi:MAG TPA: hypothetical protein GXZ90_04585 [Clostridiales bacterium]|nr:hypothetical protein [Clostridiales bacterium]